MSSISEIIPINGSILTRSLVLPNVTTSGIVLSLTPIEVPNQAVVIALGEGETLDNGILIEPDVSLGDIVLLSDHCGIEVSINNIVCKLITEKDIICVMGSVI